MAEELNLPYYDKENYFQETIQESEKIFSSKEINSIVFLEEANQIKNIDNEGNCFICGRAANYILRCRDPFSILINAPIEYRMKRVMENYSDNENEAREAIIRSDNERAKYYQCITGLTFGEEKQYSLVIDSRNGIIETVEKIKKSLLRNVHKNHISVYKKDIKKSSFCCRIKIGDDKSDLSKRIFI